MSEPVLDASITRLLESTADRRTRRVAAALVDSDSVRCGFLAAGAASRFELGSVTKGLTGMLLSDAVERGEVRLDTSMADILALPGTDPVATVTLRELATHTSGLPRLAGTAPNALRLAAFATLGLDPYRGITARRLLAVASRQRPGRRGRVGYSNLGAALLGQLLAARCGEHFAALLTARILVPCGMTGAAVAARGAAAPHGWSAAGLPRAPWIMDGYAPAGGVVATIGDLASLAVGLLRGTAPGSAGLDPLDGTADPTVAHRRRGLFWITDTDPGTGARMVWHNGATGGYSSFFALFPDAGRAVVVLADTARPARQQRIALELARRL